jgi:hypothetical protein
MGMKRRCSNRNDKKFPRYGERGIKVCDRWVNDFPAFYADMGSRPSSRHSLDRIDNDGPYSQENCRWATPKQQSNNTRRNRWLVYGDERYTVSQLARMVGLPPYLLQQRLIRDGWSLEKALSTPCGPNVSMERRK